MSLNALPVTGIPVPTMLPQAEENTAIPSAPSTASRLRPLPPATVAARRSCFQITTVDGPQVLLKLLGLFAARDLTPAVVRSVREGERHHVEVMLDGMEEHMADIVAAKISALVEVEDCLLSRFARV